MKKEVIICDICGKAINYKELRSFKVRMKELYYPKYPDELRKWYKMDVHDECFKEFCNQIALIREERKRDWDKFLKNIALLAELSNKS